MFSANLSTSVLQLFGKKSLTYESAAEKCDISSRHLGNIVRGRAVPSIATLEKLYNGLETTPNRLLLPPVPVEQVPSQTPPFMPLPCCVPWHWRPACPRCNTVRKCQDVCERCGQCPAWRSLGTASSLLLPK